MSVCIYTNRIASECIVRISSSNDVLLLFVPYVARKVKASNHYWNISLVFDYYDLETFPIKCSMKFHGTHLFGAVSSCTSVISGGSLSVVKKFACYILWGCKDLWKGMWVFYSITRSLHWEKQFYDASGNGLLVILLTPHNMISALGNLSVSSLL